MESVPRSGLPGHLDLPFRE